MRTLNLRFSTSTMLCMAMALLGSIGLVLVLATAHVYRDLAFENQREGIVDLIRLKADDRLAYLRARAVELGMSLQRHQRLREALAAGDRAAMRKELDDQFDQYFVTASRIRLEKLAVFDADMRILVTSSRGEPALTVEKPICENMLTRAAERAGPERTRLMNGLCVQGGRAYFSVLLPVGGLRPVGFLEVVTAPDHALREIQNALGMPLQIRSANDEVLYASNDWPDDVNASHMLLASFIVRSDQGGRALEIVVANDNESFDERLNSMSFWVVSLSLLATMLAVVGSSFALRVTTFNPLLRLERQIRRLSKKSGGLHADVEVAGTRETRALAEAFNQMSHDLNDMYHRLQEMAYCDQLTDLPNRNQFGERLDELVRQDGRFALLMMDMNRFKVVNDSLGHDYGDLLLKKVADRFREALRMSSARAMLAASNTDVMRDVAARIGGDEFAVLLPQVTSIEDAEQVAQRLRDAMKPPFDLLGESFYTNVSIGIVCYPDHGRDKNTLMRRADIAMYFAKNNNYEFAVYVPRLEAQVEQV